MFKPRFWFSRLAGYWYLEDWPYMIFLPLPLPSRLHSASSCTKLIVINMKPCPVDDFIKMISKKKNNQFFFFNKHIWSTVHLWPFTHPNSIYTFILFNCLISSSPEVILPSSLTSKLVSKISIWSLKFYNFQPGQCQKMLTKLTDSNYSRNKFETKKKPVWKEPFLKTVSLVPKPISIHKTKDKFSSPPLQLTLNP